MHSPKPSVGRSLAWLGLGASLFGLAFTLRPVQIPSLAFAALVLVGTAVTGIGLVHLYRRLWNGNEPSDRYRAEPDRLVATECRRVESELDLHYEAHLERRPKPSIFGKDAMRRRQWDDEGSVRYRRELREWVLGVFDNAVRCQAIAGSSRPLVEAPSASQLPLLRDLFRDAAELLERNS